MNDCKKCNGLIEKALYGNLTDTEKMFFDGHLNSCANCSDEFSDYKSIIGTIKSNPRPEPDEAFINNLWDNLEPQLRQRKPETKEWFVKFIDSFLSGMKWQYKLAGAVALFVMGLFIREFFTTTQSTNSFNHNMNTSSAQTEIYMKTADYLAKSEILMLGLMNFNPSTDDAETINLQKQQEISKKLLTQAVEIKAGLNSPQQQQMKKLVSDIEMILVQIANLDPGDDSFGIELVKEGVETKSIILKINIQKLKENFEEFSKTGNSDNKENKRI